MCKGLKIDMDKPFKELSKEEKDYIFYGSKGKGVHLALEKINGKLEIHDNLFWSIKL